MNLLQVLAADAYEFEAKSELSGVQIALIIAVSLLVIAGMWKAFVKAGQPGWAVLIPFYNLYVMCKIAGRPGWWLLLFFVPIVNIVISFILNIDIAKRFNKGAGFGVGLTLLGAIFWPILGFGSATYGKPLPDARVFE